jgi:hypothetical protein
MSRIWKTVIAGAVASLSILSMASAQTPAAKPQGTPAPEATPAPTQEAPGTAAQPAGEEDEED